MQKKFSSVQFNRMPNQNISLISAYVAAFSISLLLCTTSQADPVLPPMNSAPGAIIQNIQQPKKDPLGFLSKPKADVLNSQDKGEENETSKTLEETKIFIKNIEVKDQTLLTNVSVQKVTRSYLNRDVSFQELQDLGAKLTALYREKGYITSRIYLPPQKIVDGKVIYQASEGQYGVITLEEGKFFKSRSVFPRLDLDRSKPLNVNDIKKNLARYNENPDIGLQANLKPGKNQGETEVVLKANDRVPAHVTPFIDNLGRRLIGEERIGVIAAYNNLFGFGDKVTQSINGSRGSIGTSTNYEIPIGRHGTKLGFNYAHSRLRLGKEFRPLDVQGFATIYSPYISQEIFRGKNLLVSADIALDFKNLGTDILDQKFSRDRLRVLRPGINLEEFDKWGRTSIRHELGLGLDILDASGKYRVLASRQGSGDGFFRYTGFATRIQRLPLNATSISKLVGQYSPSLLNSAEQMQVGGAFTVRGYKEGQLIGDSGWIVSEEIRVPAFIFPKTLRIPMTKYSLRDNIQFVGFLEGGAVYTNDFKGAGSLQPIAGIRNYAAGAGAGVRFRLTKLLIGRFDVGFPLVKVPQGQRHHDFTLHFGLQSEPF